MTQLIDHLAKYVTQQTDFKAASPVWVSVYEVSQHFGGPEEGGWWYHRSILQGGKPFPSREQAEAWLETARREVERMNEAEKPARYRAMASLPDEDEMPCPANCPEGYIPNDWTDGGEFEVVIEEELGSQDNSREPRPHYE